MIRHFDARSLHRWKSPASVARMPDGAPKAIMGMMPLTKAESHGRPPQLGEGCRASATAALAPDLLRDDGGERPSREAHQRIPVPERHLQAERIPARPVGAPDPPGRLSGRRA